MVWRTCPVRCKGGREVSKKTRSKHQELRDREHQQLLQQYFPEAVASSSNTPGSRKRHHANDDSQGARSKKVRESGGQRDDGEMRKVYLILLFAMNKVISIATNRLGRTNHQCDDCSRDKHRSLTSTAQHFPPAPSLLAIKEDIGHRVNAWSERR